MNRDSGSLALTAIRKRAPLWARIRGWWNLPRAIGLVAALLGLFHYLPLPSLPIPSLITLHADLAPELVGIGITLVLIDWAVAKRQKEELRNQLIRQMGNRHNDVADPAVRELAYHGWLFDGSLVGANLFRAGLKACDLRGAIMPGVDLERADLQGARLDGAILTTARLFEADFASACLKGADLKKTHLQCARLMNANLTGANLEDALVSEANLIGADLSFASLKNARFLASDLSKAIFYEANLSGADLGMVNLTGVHLTLNQLKQARALFGATMPDGVQLGWDEEIQGPTFAEWEAQYRARHSGTETNLRGN